MWGESLIAGYTYELKEGNGPRTTITFKWNGTEPELGTWPERLLLNRYVISSLVHQRSTDQDWVLLDAEDIQVEVKDLQLGPYRIIKKNALIDIVHRHDQKLFIPGDNMAERIRRAFELEEDWWFLRSRTEEKSAEHAIPGTEYRIESGRLNYLEWRN
jgi:hypothetical protein